MRGDRLTMRDYLQPVLHRTTDGGDTWEPYILLSQGEWVLELAVNPAVAFTVSPNRVHRGVAAFRAVLPP